jgi:hypothetical protein
VLSRRDSVRFLQQCIAILDETKLGDSPLALDEAAAYLDQTQIDLDSYLILVRDQERALSLSTRGRRR